MKTFISNKNLILMFVITSILTLNSCTNSNEPVDSPDISPYKWVNSIHTNFGVPYDKDTTDDYLIVRDQYVVNYNKLLNVPNFVCWEINENWFGDVSRWSGNFITDTTLPIGLYRIKHSDYTNSGYDRGHLVQSESRTKTEEDNKSTFILTNILPQSPDLNQGVWYKFEYFCNGLALNGHKELFVIAGGIYHNKNRIKEVLTIPDSCFKIVVVLEKGQTYKDINDQTQIIAVNMPNISGVRNDEWSKYITTIRQIENSTGFNFLNNLKRSIQDIIENKKYTL